MSSRAVCAFLLVLLAGPLFAQDWERFAAGSDRSEDGFILQTMTDGDLETGIALCRGLGRRKDLDVQAVIDFLVTQHTPGSEVKSELLLRWLITSVREAHRQEEALRAWTASNAQSLDMLLAHISVWKSAQLKGALLGLAVIAPGTRGANAIMDVGQEVVQELEDSSDGLIPSQDSALALDFLAAARRASSSDFFPLCVSIARLSREKVLVDAARSAARALASAR